MTHVGMTLKPMLSHCAVLCCLALDVSGLILMINAVFVFLHLILSPPLTLDNSLRM